MYRVIGTDACSNMAHADVRLLPSASMPDGRVAIQEIQRDQLTLTLCRCSRPCERAGR